MPDGHTTAFEDKTGGRGVAWRCGSGMGKVAYRKWSSVSKQYAAAVDPTSRLKRRAQKIFELQLKKTRGSWEDQLYSILLLSLKQKLSADIHVLQSAFLLTTLAHSFLYLSLYIRTDILISTSHEEENHFGKSYYQFFKEKGIHIDSFASLAFKFMRHFSLCSICIQCFLLYVTFSSIIFSISVKCSM